MRTAVAEGGGGGCTPPYTESGTESLTLTYFRLTLSYCCFSPECFKRYQCLTLKQCFFLTFTISTDGGSETPQERVAMNSELGSRGSGRSRAVVRG